MTTNAGDATRTDDGTLQAAADSAEGVAAVRAIAAAAHATRIGQQDQPVVGVDDLAVEMLSHATRSHLPTVAQLEAGLPGLLETEAARTAFFDQYLLAEVSAGIDQIIILASGFDTRPYRFRDTLRHATVFEVDRAPMIQVKTQRVRAALAPVSNVRTVAADLSTGFPARPLADAGLDTRRPVAVLCCGASMYLPATAFTGILHAIARMPVGSSLALDYVFRKIVEGDDTFRGAAQIRARLAAAGQTQILGFDPGELAAAVRAAGLSTELDLDPSDIATRLLRDELGNSGEPLGYHCIALLRTDGSQ